MFKFVNCFRAAALASAALVLGVSAAEPAFAHGGAKSRHGGIVQVTSDLGFELVAEADGAAIYLVDHDLPLAAKGIAGRLSVLKGSSRTEVAIGEAGANKLRATGVKLGKGDKVVAVLNNVKGKTVTVRFTVK